jgi:hypothetical protein
MKPSQFKRIEKSALIQRNQLITNKKKAEKLGLKLSYGENAASLNNLIATMKSLKRS